MRLGLLVAAARVLGGRDADAERIGRGLRCLAVDKCATMGRDLRPETTALGRTVAIPAPPLICHGMADERNICCYCPYISTPK